MSSAYDPSTSLSLFQRREDRDVEEAELRETSGLFGGPLPSAKVPDIEERAEITEDSGYAQSMTNRAIVESGLRKEERERFSDVNLAYNVGMGALGTVAPNEGFEFEGQKGDAAEKARESYLEADSDSTFLQPETMVDPSQDSGDPWYSAQSITKTLFSDEMGLLGIKWDQEGVSWARENFVNQITEHPYSTGLTLAAYLVPIGAAWMKGARIAKRAAGIAASSDTAVDAAAVTARGMFGKSNAVELEAMGGTWETMKALGPRVRFDDHAQLVKGLAFSEEINDGRKFFSDSRLKAIKEAATDEDIAKLVPEKELRKMLIGDMHAERYLGLKKAAAAGENMNPMKRAELKLWETFGNTYFKNLTDMDADQIIGIDKWLSKAGLGRWLAAAPVALNKIGQQSMYKYWAGKGSYDDLVRTIGDDAAGWAGQMKGQWTDLFKAQADEGFIDGNTVKMFNEEFGGFHLPAILKGTAGFEDLGVTSLGFVPGKSRRYGDLIATKRLDPAKVLSPATMKTRGKRTTWANVESDLDEIITDPQALTVGGFIRDNVLFQVHRGFRDLITEQVKKNPKVSQYMMDADKYDALPEHAKKYWTNINDLDKVAIGLAPRMDRMVKAALTKEGIEAPGRLPMIKTDVVDQFFGKEGSAAQGAREFSKMFELLTAVHKTARTALNPPTHMSNLLGNFVFLAMAGMSPVSAVALDDGKLFARAFASLAKRANKSPEAFDDLMNKDALIEIFGKDRFMTDNFGGKIDLAEVFASDKMKLLIESQAFEAVEGLRHVNELLKQMERLEPTGFGAKAVSNVARTVAGFGEVKGIKGTLHMMSSAYLGEDVVPKMMYVSHLLRKGWGTDAIVKEVGRRLPQYRTVGELQQKARKVVLPWITFPSEAARIMKNNMMDMPVSMMAWMKAPAIAQSIAYGAGVAPDFQEVEDLIDGAQPWAKKYQSIMLDEKAAPPVLGAVGGAAVMGMVGTALGGAKGAAAGAAGGAALGAFIGKKSPTHQRLTQNDLGEMARSWSLDFLPQSAMMFTTTHPHEWEKLDPMSNVPTSGREATRTAFDMSPMEPFAIAMPLIELASGRGSFGREIETKSSMEWANKLALGLYGFMMPPMMQKYGMKIEGPGGAYVPMADIFTANGGQMTLPKSVTAGMAGLTMGGLTFLGARTGLGASLPKAAMAAATAGIPGAMAGAEINTRRLMTDLGVMDDPYTNKRGDWTMDFFFNTFLGANKSWKVSTSQAIAAEERRHTRFDKMRTSALKEYMDGLRHGQESKTLAARAAIYKSFVLQHADVDQADQKMIAWDERVMGLLLKTPQFRSISKDNLETRIAAFKEMLRLEKSKFKAQILSELETELQQRRMNKAIKLKVEMP